jgi:hypothetical protein
MSDPTTWTAEDVVDWMLQEQEASTGLAEVQSAVFRAQAEGSWRIGHDVYWAALEARWKEKTDGKPIPSKYRSSKSVLKNAIDLGIDVRGKGKTAIEKEIKEVRAKEAAASSAAPPAGATTTSSGTPAAITHDLTHYRNRILDVLAEANARLPVHEYGTLLEEVKTWLS